MDFVKFEETQVFPLIPMVETFVEQLASLIEKKED